jgi:hypothetical protein
VTQIFELVGKLGIGGGIGFLIGLVLVSWVKPDTGGMVLLILVPVIISMTIASIVTKIWSGKGGEGRK